MEKKVTIFDGSRNGTREVEAKVDAERIVDFLMSEGSPLAKHCGGSGGKGFWEGYAEALRNIVDEYDLADAIADCGEFEEWLADDEQERRGL